ncbi:ABC transporter ATP-binding protein [Vallitalea longa]|uniref:ABC transporter ATP-binding protein n=1 Tax=Vallitalea longa TaxID=2936439 RepID=A0A9W5Y9G5_9FIRM|nr:ATP-binding cassette domain-containing protein [Vallitalea longa]GKX28361.1 ABC transporter ATP-binding protein [Vallitalea longa]
MFEIKNITKKFDNEVALSNVSLNIEGGMNYIIGASGSGKTTLLRILSAMNSEYSGEAFYNGKNLKTFTTDEKAKLYGNDFGFIAQNFNLIDEFSVEENILIPTYIKNKNCDKQLKLILKKFNLKKISHQKVSTLSGGQKQRVAIARELMKNPKVLIADEPTSALDAKTAKEISDILHAIAKERTVIIVTHDISLIKNNCSVFELDKGVLCRNENINYTSKSHSNTSQRLNLSIKSSYNLAKVSLKRQLLKMLSLIIAIVITSSCLAVSVDGFFGDTNKKELDNSNNPLSEILSKQGNSIYNLMILSSFVNGSSGQGVDQNISGFLEKYQFDSRVKGITTLSNISDAVVTMEGKDFIIDTSGSTPLFNKIVSGKNVDNSKYEVVLPEVLVEKMGHTNESIIGKELHFNAGVYNHEKNNPVLMPVSFTVNVCGVADTSYTLKTDNGFETFADEDDLFFSLVVMEDMYKQAEITDMNMSFTITPNSPEECIEIYDELMSQGIVPLGQIEFIRDMVGLQNETDVQMKISYALIAAISLFASLSICFVLSLTRKKQYAIYKLNGFTKSSITRLTFIEYMAMLLLCSAVCIIATLLLNISLILEVLMVLSVILLCFIENSLLAINVNIIKALKTGDR